MLSSIGGYWFTYILIPDFYGIRSIQAGLNACSIIKMKEVKDDFTAS
jgi:hypothetical protein